MKSAHCGLLVKRGHPHDGLETPDQIRGHSAPRQHFAGYRLFRVTAQLDGNLIQKGNRFTYTSRGDETGRRGTFKIDPTANPKQLEWTAMGEEKKVLAIYKLESDRLTICAGSGDKRPREFTTKPGDGQVIVIYQRQKK